MASLIALSMTMPAPAFAQESIESIGDLPGNGTSSTIYRMTPDGTAIVGSSPSALAAAGEAFVWISGQGFTALGDLPGGPNSSMALGVNNTGNIVVGSSLIAGSDTMAFRWINGQGLIALGDLPGGTNFSAAYAVSDNGTVVVGASRSAASGNFFSEAFRWVEGVGMSPLGDLNGGLFNSSARAVTPNGSIVVGYGASAAGIEAFRWVEGVGMSGLGMLAGAGSSFSGAQDVNDLGNIVVGVSRSALGDEAFRWVEGVGMSGLGDLTGGIFSSIANGVNSAGNVVVGRGTSASGDEAFRWIEGGSGMESVRDILLAANVNMTGWVLSEARAVDDTGDIVAGNGTLNGVTTGWIANLASGGLSTPGDIAEGLRPATQISQQVESSMNTNLGQSLFASTNALQTLGQVSAPAPINYETANPADIAPAAGGPASTRRWAGYAVGSFGIGHDNDFDNHEVNGTLGVVARVNDSLAIGAGVIANNSTAELNYDGQSDLNAVGASLIAAYEAQESGLRLYGTAFVAHLNVDVERRYINGGGFDQSRGETEGIGYGASVRAGWEVPVAHDISFMPYAELQITRTELDGYTETGGGFPATFDDQELQQITSRLGAQLSYDITPDFTLKTRAAWAHRIDEDHDDLRVSTTGFTGILSDSGSGDRDWAEAAIGGVWRITNATLLTGELSARTGRVEDPAAVATIGVQVNF